MFGSARKAAPARGEARVAEGVEIDSDGNRARAMTYLVNEAPRAMQGAGGRRVSMAVLQRLLDFGCSYDEAIDLMLEYWNEAKADPPWDDDELRATFRGVEGSRQTPLGSRSPEGLFDVGDVAEHPSNGSGSRRPRPTAPRGSTVSGAKRSQRMTTPPRVFMTSSAKTTANI